MLAHRYALWIVTLVTVALILSACGGGNDETNGDGSTTGESISTSVTGNQTEPAADQITKSRPSGEVPTVVPPPESDFDEDGDGFMTLGEVRAGMETALNSFAFPEGYVFSIDRAIDYQVAGLPEGMDEDNTTFENGTDLAWIGMPHMCAWGKTWLSANAENDDASKKEAMTQLESVTLALPSLRLVIDYYQGIFDKAKLGDIAPLQALIESECNWDVFEATPIATVRPDMFYPVGTYS